MTDSTREQATAEWCPDQDDPKTRTTLPAPRCDLPTPDPVLSEWCRLVRVVTSRPPMPRSEAPNREELLVDVVGPIPARVRAGLSSTSRLRRRAVSAADRTKLDVTHAFLLGMVDGTRTLNDVLIGSGMPPNAAWTALTNLLRLGLVSAE